MKLLRGPIGIEHMRPLSLPNFAFRLGVVCAVLLGSFTTFSTPAQAASTTVAIAATDGGYYRLEADGTIVSSSATDLGSSGVTQPTAIAATPVGSGYWVTGSTGQIDAFGDAAHYGDLSQLQLAHPIIAMEPTPTGGGYWLVGADGGVFAFGDASFYGSMGGIALAAGVVGIASSPTGNGYWLVASDGGVFTFGDAEFLGSMGGVQLNQPVIGISGTPSGSGYFMVASDGGVFAFGNAPFLGSVGGQGRTDFVALSPTPTGAGYVLASFTGEVLSFGDGGVTNEITPSPLPIPPAATPYSFEADLLTRVNAERTLRGIPALTWDPDLAAMATEWSWEMSRSGLRHSDLDSQILRLEVQQVALGENIYWGFDQYATPAAAHTWFMGSAGHRTALLESAYTTAGFGVACVDGALWVTQLFARPAVAGQPTFSGTAPASPRANLSQQPTAGC